MDQNMGPKQAFTGFVLYWKFLLFAFFLHKFHIWKNICSWDNVYNEIIPRFAFIEIAWVFLHVHIYLKLIKKILGGHDRKCARPVWLWDSKIDCISKMNIWNELIFCMLVQIQESWKLLQWFYGGCGQKCAWAI